MKTLVRISLAAAGALSFLTIMPAASFAEMAYPEKCKSGMDMSKMDMMSGDMGMGDMMTDDQKASMEGMKSMHMNMMQGMMKKDADVAFVCASMIFWAVFFAHSLSPYFSSTSDILIAPM